MIAIYVTATGRLVSQAASAEDVASPLPANLSQKTVADHPDDYAWDTAALDFVASLPPRFRSKTAWVNQLTNAELRGMATAETTLTGTVLANVLTFRLYLGIIGDKINLDDNTVTGGLTALVTAGIINAARRTALLT